MKKALPIFIFLTLLTLQFNHAFAQPSNDVCTNATSLTSGTTCNYISGSTTGATQSVSTSCGNSTGDDDVWYSFVAQATTHLVQVQSGSGFDAVIDARTGACTGTNIGCIDVTSSGGVETASLTSLTVGSTYLIRVYHYGTGEGTGSFQICVTHTAPSAPTNDVCTNAISLTSGSTCSYISGSTTGATQSVSTSCGNSNGDDDVWYSFVAQATTHLVQVQSGSGFDAVIDARTGSCTGTNIGCIDVTSSGGVETASLTSLTVGTTYLVRVYHFGSGSGTGNFQICVTHSAPSAPANDVCTSAISLTSGTTCNYTAGSTTGATQSVSTSCGNSNGDDDVWYSFVAQATTHLVQVQSGSGFDAVIDARTGSCTGTNIGCIDVTSSGGVETASLTSLTVGTTYLVRVYNFGSGSGTGNFQICVTHTGSSAPANDVCTSATSLTSGTTCNYTSGTTTGATQSVSTSCGSSNGDDDVWYSFVAQATTHLVQVQGATGFDPVIDVRSGACTGTNIGCIDVSGTGGLETASLTNLVVGTTYLVRVYHFGSGSGTGNFQICVTHTGSSAPANDDCANAIIINSATTCTPQTGTTTGATQSLTTSCGSSNADDDVWYRFVAQATSHTVTVHGFGAFDAVLEIRNAPACSGSNISCTDVSSAGGTETANLTSLVVGATYAIRIYHFGSGSGGGSFDVCVTHVGGSSAPANDICSNAISLTSGLSCNYTTGTTTGATQSITANCNSANGDDDVWYSFVAQATSHVVKVQGGAGFDAVIDVRSSSSCTGTNISCTDASGSAGLESATLTALTVGTTYLVRVYHFTAGSGGGSFQICVTHTGPPTPPNDLCAQATSITSATSCTYTTGSTSGATQSITGTCNGNGDDDVWYSFTAVATSHVVKVQAGSGFDAVIDIRSGACTGTNVSCTDATGSAGLETANLTGLTVGATYYARVYHHGAGSGGGSFQICVTHTATSAPSNDICTSATSLTSATTCNYTNGSTTGASQSIPGTCNGNGDDDVWYSFVAVSSNHKVDVQCAAGFDGVIDIRNSPDCSGSNILCKDGSGGGGLETASLTGLTVGNTYMVRVYNYGTGAGSGSFQICVTHVTQSCTYSISPTNLSFTSAGGTGTVTVTSGSGCNWTATTTDAWITITSGSSGTSNGTVTYTVASNSGSAQRTGTITIGGQTHTVAQSGNNNCTYTVSPLNQTFTSSAGNGTVTVTTTGSCNWAATSNDSWITVTSGSSGTGNGTVTYTITSNSTTSQRVGTITIAGQVYTVTQNGTIPCTYTISPTNLSYAASGGSGTVTVTTTGGCNWTASTTDAWITITSGSSGSGNGTVTYTVASNSGSSQRTGSITIGGQTHTVAQNGNNNCTFTISPLNQTFTSTGGTGTVTVTAANGCNWAATSNDAWITVTTGSTGSGNGTVTYTVAANSGSSQLVGTITIAGQVHSITQSGIAPCSYSITPTTLSFTASGGPGSVSVSAAQGCNWTATSNDAWITISSGSTGSGNGTVSYTVASNTTTTQRTGTITVAGQTHTVTQNGLQCTFTIAPTALSYTATGGTGTVNVTAAAGCSWTATTSDSWITITSGTGSGSGTAGYTVTANTGTAQRLGSVTVAGQTHTVVQNGTSSCSYTLAPTSQTFTAIAGTGSFNVSASSGCNWTAISNDSWIFISSGNTGSGNGTVNFTVDASTSTTQRTGTITVGGQIYTVTQAGITCPTTPIIQSVGCSLAANLIPNVTYQWYISGTPIIGASSQFYTANQPGYYSLFVTDNTNGCVASSQPAYVACSGVGVEEFDLADAIDIFPNPSSGNFTIKSSGIFTEDVVKVSIINVYGQSIYSSSVVPQNGEITLTIDNVNPAKGTYTVLFTSGTSQIAKRVIVD